MLSNTTSLQDFVDFLYNGLEGLVYVAAMEPEKPETWQQEFFKYPQDQDKLIRTIRGANKTHEVYLSPSIWAAPKAQREYWKASNVVWTEFDGNTPDFEGAVPTLIVQSSEESHTHVYWRLSEPVTSVDTLEDINRRITYNMGADSSAWDAVQVLRPPSTINHKHGGLPVFVRSNNLTAYDVSIFEELAPAPEQVNVEWEVSALPDPQTVIFRHAFTPDIIQLLNKPKHEIKDRSGSLMNLAYGCAQMGMTDNEIMVMLTLADDKWEKFSRRRDRMKRLAHIIMVARNKYPEQNDSSADDLIMVMGFQSFLATEIEIDWILEGFLMERGMMLLVGPGGIGKTQFTLQALIHIALGKDWLHYKAGNPKKVLFLSLEMGHGELKIFLEAMSKALDPEEQALLEQNLLIIPLGEPWPLNTLEGQAKLIEILEEFQPDGLAVDSIGSAVRGNISSDESVQPFLEFNDKIRNRYNMFTWYIHHARKQPREGNHTLTQDDVYGNQYIFNRSSSTYMLSRAKGGNIRVKNLKQRLAKEEIDYVIARNNSTLNYLVVNRDVEKFVESLVYDPDAETPTAREDTAPGGFDL